TSGAWHLLDWRFHRDRRTGCPGSSEMKTLSEDDAAAWSRRDLRMTQGGRVDWKAKVIENHDGGVLFRATSKLVCIGAGYSAAVTFESTPSRSGVMSRSCLARITTSHSGSNFFQPAA